MSNLNETAMKTLLITLISIFTFSQAFCQLEIVNGVFQHNTTIEFEGKSKAELERITKLWIEIHDSTGYKESLGTYIVERKDGPIYFDSYKKSAGYDVTTGKEGYVIYNLFSFDIQASDNKADITLTNFFSGPIRQDLNNCINQKKNKIKSMCSMNGGMVPITNESIKKFILKYKGFVRAN